MGLTNWENIWQLMRRNDFQLINDIIDEYKCTICRKILINACNAPCGCRFCNHCISTYLNESDKYCPGNIENCKEEVINFSQDIQIDRAINIRISKMVVKCPEKTCKFKDELRKIEDHIKMCRTREVNCPFFTVGCTETLLINEKMEKHMEIEEYGHIKLLMEYVGHLKQEMESMKSEIEALKIDSSTKQVIISQLLMANMERKSETESRGEIVKETKLDLNGKNQMCSIDLSVFGENRKRRNVDTSLEQLCTKLIKVEKVAPVAIDSVFADDFQWRIGKFREKWLLALDGINTEIHSEPFYSHKNGYKLRLVLCPGGSGSGKGTHMSIFFQIMKVAIVSHQDGIDSVYRNYQYDSLPDKIRCTFLQPLLSDFNTSCGNPRFISLDSLMNNCSLYKNDEIVLKCSVTATKS